MLFHILSETDRKKVEYLRALIFLAVEGGIYMALRVERFCFTKSMAQSIIPLREKPESILIIKDVVIFHISATPFHSLFTVHMFHIKGI